MISAAWTIRWDRGTASVSKLGAMLGPANFAMDDARSVQPFAIAPWFSDDSAEHEALPPLLRQLRGEWACVPYGMPTPPMNLPSPWRPGSEATGEDDWFHGYSSNGEWQLDTHDDNALALSLDYPDTHSVRRVTRHISGTPGRAQLAFELGIETRADTALPIGLHPTFRLPSGPGQATLTFDGDVEVHTYPIATEAGVSRIVSDRHGLPLHRVPCTDGTFADLSRHPLPFVTEELVMVTGHGGGATLTNMAEGYAMRLQWDEAAFPCCQLWMSNRGRTAYPWNGRFQALAIEPVVAAFDLGTAVSRRVDNPLRQNEIPTTQSFAANATWSTRYTIEVMGLHA